MFACACYPGTESFLKTVEQEARFQVRRLSRHPCVALFCGNNENEEGILCFDEIINASSAKSAESYYRDYDSLSMLLERVVNEEAHGYAWWPSSPSNGSTRISHRLANSCICTTQGSTRSHSTECFLATQAPHPNAQNRGDNHFWGVWHGNADFAAYAQVKPKFCSEFGFQSFPSVSALASEAIAEDLLVSGEFLELRQRSPVRGNRAIFDHVARQFHLPKTNLLSDWWWLSQLLQALSIQRAVEHFRRLPDCRGAIYWSLNDIANFASWSSLEFSGRWKICHYFVKRFFASLLFSGELKPSSLDLFLSGDGSISQASVEWRAELVSWSDGSRIEIASGETTPTKLGALQVASLPCDTDACLLPGGKHADPANFFVHLHVVAVGSPPQHNFVLLTPMREALLRHPSQVETKWITESTLQLTCRNAVAAFVTVDADGVVFSDSGFMLCPNEPVLLQVHPLVVETRSVDYAKVHSTLSVRWLQQTF